MRWLVLAGLMALAACDTTMGVNDGPAPEVSRQQATAHFHSALRRVRPVAEQLCQDRAVVQNCDFHIVIDDRPGRAPNAFQSLGADGQPVLTFTAAMIAEARNQDEIALIIAHEAAHHVAGHLARLNRQVALNAANEAQADGGSAVDVQARVHAFELAADALGAQIMAAAGFDPHKAALIFARLPVPAGGHSRTHPAHAERSQAVRQAVLQPL